MCLKTHVISLEHCMSYIYETPMYIGHSLSKSMPEIKSKKYSYVIPKHPYILETPTIYYQTEHPHVILKEHSQTRHRNSRIT